VALDAHKRPVDTVTSNLGHLLWSDFLTEHEQELIARRLISRPMSSGYGLRTMSTDSTGYWPLSYHGGSVWAHDTAIAIAGLTRAGYRAQADSLVNGLLDAAAGFGYRMPELHSGDESSAFAKVVPYPSACRPQAWAAAASVSVLTSVLGLRPRGDELEVSAVPGRSMVVTGLRFGGQEISVNVNEHGDVTRWLGPVLTH
jgi:glycogen debranching enzyme